MKLKMLLNLTAFAFFVLVTTFPSQADPQKMYGIQGDKLSIATTVPAPNAYSVKGKIYTTKDADEAKNYSKEGLASYYH